jgi:hypothetical protein
MPYSLVDTDVSIEPSAELSRKLTGTTLLTAIHWFRAEVPFKPPNIQSTLDSIP